MDGAGYHVLLLLAVLQGVFEWLPVSSSGLETAVAIMMGYRLSTAYSLALSLHLASALAAAIIFHEKIRSLLHGIFYRRDEESTAYVVAVAVSFIIGGPIVVLLTRVSENIDAALGLLAIGVLLLVTASINYLRGRVEGMSSLGFKHYVAAGVAQGIAALPGLSRSGLVLGTMAFMRVVPEKAYEASMVLGVPVLAAAGLYGLYMSWGLVSAPVYAALFLVAFILNLLIGYLMLRFIRRINVGAFTLFVAALIIFSSLLSLIG